jgi:DNA-binding MarR family transcriptional regulator
VDEPLALSALLSQALVAFTIELDDAFERAMPHRTTNHGTVPGDLERPPWLVSMAMWANCLRYVPADGIAAGALARRARVSGQAMATMLKRMGRWWGYLVVAPDPAVPRAAWVVRPTRAGRRAQAEWEPLPALIEDRWRERFGADAVDRLRAALAELVAAFDSEPPDALPIGTQSHAWRAAEPGPAEPSGGDAADRTLPTLLAQALLAFTLDAERDAPLPLPLSANVVRVLDGPGERVRDLPQLTGLAKMAIDNALSLLTKGGHVAVGADPTGGRAKHATLTALGREAHGACAAAAATAERAWEERFGVAALRAALEGLVGTGEAGRSPLLDGMPTSPEGWRATLPPRTVLPHYPMVSHRGGFPDGS